MNKSFLDLVGLAYLWGKIKEYVASYSSLTTNSGTVTVNIGGNSSVVPTKTSLITNDSGFITSADIPEGAAASTTTPLMDGTAAVGTETAFARGDHRHPSDTTKADKVSNATANNLAALDANGNLIDSGVSATSAGTDTKNTTGATQVTLGSEEKLYLVGAKTQGNNPLTYTDSNVYLTVPNGALHVGGLSANTVSATNGNFIDINTGSIKLTSSDFSRITYGLTEQTTLQSVLDSKLGSLVSGTNVKTINDNSIVGSGNLELTGYDIQMAVGDEQREGVYINDGMTVYNAIFELDSTINDILSEKGQANGIASLDSSGRVPSSQLPSYVDDVVEVYPRTGQTALSQNWLSLTSGGAAITPLAGVIYVLMASSGDYAVNTEFRWGGNTYVLLNDGGVSELTTSEMDTATNNWT